MEDLVWLQNDMVVSFRRYHDADPSARDVLWDAYVRARERFLRYTMGDDYRPLKVVEEFH